MQVVTPVDDSSPYGPWGGFGIMALWVLASLVGAYVLLKRRDA
jgi:ABC-2 type transport system permease protein